MKIFPVMVVYRADLADCNTYLSLLRPAGVGEALVVDNSPASRPDLGGLPEGYIYRRDVDNGGLSKAYNLGARIASERGYSHLLLLDQDTAFPPEAWEVYMAHLENDCLMAPMMQTRSGLNFSPVGIGGWGHRPLPMLQPGRISLYEEAVVNSGSLIPVDLFLESGGYDERVTLDFSDYQFQQRLRRIRPEALILPFTAVQDFSNDVRDFRQIAPRFRRYLDCARRFTPDSGQRPRLNHHYTVLRHTLSLLLRTRNPRILGAYFRYFLFA